MTRIEKALIRVDKDLSELKVQWALVGGFALAARGVPRATFDLDIAVAVENDSEAENLIRSLRERSYSIKESIEQEAAGRLATVRLIAPDDLGIGVDLLFASSGIETEIVEMAEILEIFEGLKIPVAATGHILIMKILAGRPYDLEDAKRLFAFTTEGDLELARQAADLISQRGFDRRKNLAEELEQALRQAPRGGMGDPA